ncbi:MAG: PSD1 and planctomycete cytochrome C domain-containing protein [Bryobacteraceae bacterium]
MEQFLAAMAALALAAPGLMAAEVDVDYQRDIRPVLAKKCFACHGPDEHARQMNLRLDTHAGATGAGGGYKGIVPGDSAASRVVARITDERRPMPPTGPGLTPGEVALIRKWIDAGAKYTAHWSFQKPVRPEVPMSAEAGGNEIDTFVRARLRQESLAASPEADAATLARRAALDLTGLPPEPAALKQYLGDPSPAGYERFVDQLLASPAYGERWARVWLDLARYADTQGYEKDNKRTIWPYRDWVIRALNDNMPFDRFTIEQLAGDLLPGAGESQLIATGFHRNTMTNTEGGTDDEEFRDAAVKDRVAVTGQVWMGLTIGCAQCHTHKYDPISHEEFYRFYSYFNQTADHDQPNDAPVLKLAGDTSTLILRELAGDKRRVTRIHQRGNFLDPGQEVSPGVPAAFHALPKGAPANRLGLAQWLVSKENPLTARVMVNRLWARLFGTGLVETEEDFGTQGAAPTHPQLLDWLAVEFMDRGWDVKAILKTMVMSATYRQSSAADAGLLEKDPRNRLLARGPRVRLDAEMVRDQALAVSGLLSKKMYGAPVMPWQPEGIWLVVYSGDKWETSEGEDRYRRGLYTFLRRSSPYPSMITYDAPTGEVCTIRRIRTNTPLQALASLNDPVSMEAAQRLARWAIEDIKGNEKSRIEAMFRRVLVRDPVKAETSRILSLYRDAAKELKSSGDAPGKLLHYDQTLYTGDREVLLVADARTAAREWRFMANDDGTAPGADWFQPGFDASQWRTGKGQFAWYKKPPEDSKIATEWHTSNIWLRIEFDVPEGSLEDVQLHVRTAGMFESYVNGVRAAQSPIDRGSYYEYLISDEAAATLKPGKNVLAIHATHIREKDSGQVIDASLRALRPMQFDKRKVDAKRAAWVVVANTLLNLDETLSRR